MKKLLLAVAAVGCWMAEVRADAVLTSGSTRTFPSRVEVAVTARAQIESTTLVFEFAPLTVSGTFELTVPSPVGGAPIGVDVDNGHGFVALPAVLGAPPSAGGGSDEAALGGWAGTTPLVATLEQLAPGPLAVRVRFVRILRRVGNQVPFDVGVRRCPLRSAGDPGALVRMRIAIETQRQLSRFDTDGGTGTAVEFVPGGARVHTQEARLADSEVVRVTYGEHADGIHVQLVAHRTPTADPLGGSDGYFLLLVDGDPAISTTPRTVSMVLDHSGSMSGEKMTQARDAARAMLDHLRPTDDFAIHIFDSDVDSFRSSPVPATAENISAARAYIKDIDANSGTNLDAGLQAGLRRAPSADRFDALVFLSDGLANQGISSAPEILDRARTAASNDTRLFTFSVGADADFALMEALARQTRGRHIDLNNAQATRDLVVRARELFEDIRDVRLADLSLGLDGIGAVEMFPAIVPDLMSGGQVVVVGRYAAPGASEVVVNGIEGTNAFVKAYPVETPELAELDEIIKYVWATEKVRTLMAEMAAGGDEAMLRAQIEELGLAYRIQTPFTQFSGDAGGADSVGCTAAADNRGSFALLALILVGLVGARRARPATR